MPSIESRCVTGLENMLFAGMYVFFLHCHMRDFHQKCLALKVDVLQVWKICCLQACMCTFQARNFTGLGSEGVKLSY